MRWPLVLCVVCLLCAACGRPASEQDCERIVARITELELRGANRGTEEITEQVAETKSAMKAKVMAQCVGRRIRASALECVEKATSAEQIVEDCFD